MLISNYRISPDRRQYPSYPPPVIGAQNPVAETYVTRSMVDRYGPIVSPTVSPTKPFENNDTLRNRPTIIHVKTERDYEAAALICSMRDSVNSLDTMRVSRISTMLKPSSSMQSEHTVRLPTIETFGQSLRNEDRLIQRDIEGKNHEYSQGSRFDEKDNEIKASSHSDETDGSEGENEDFSMIVRPREPEHHDHHDSPSYTCRLPCCTRVAYSNSSPDNGRYSPIRVPARRPAPHLPESPPRGNSESEQNGGLSRYRDGSAFSTVSPGKKRHDSEFTFSNMPSVKVRVIQECSQGDEKLTNGHSKSPIKTENSSENGRFYKNGPSLMNNVSPKTKIFNGNLFQDPKNIPKKEEFSYINSALVNAILAKKTSDDKSPCEVKQERDTSAIAPRPTSTYANGLSSGFSFTYPANFVTNFDYSFGKREAPVNGHHTPLVQCSTVDSTASETAEGESRLLDLARVANEQLGEELAKRQPPVSKRVKQKSNDCLHLWEFLRDILNNESMSPRAIEWTVKERGEFRLIKTGVVAQLWGMSKNRTSMTYEKMARAMRYYYKMKILEKVPHKRLHFRFGKHMLPKVLVSKE
eukprot:Seg1054.10 transcript_id=Seg1054.10/GoldUCD/mRNA.D3Y31 product="ETS-like factor" protein_id=Seg1054.10/GoldUCD/D3Y31